jgi:hypothetical protein
MVEAGVVSVLVLFAGALGLVEAALAVNLALWTGVLKGMPFDDQLALPSTLASEL